jgi:serine protease Do
MKNYNFIKCSKKFILFLTLSLIQYFSVLPISAQTWSNDEQNNINVYETVSPAIVGVDADIKEGTSSGTGCIIYSKGLIITSSHVVEGHRGIKVTMPDGKTYSGKVIADNIDNDDFALIKIKPDSPLPVIKFGNSSSVKVGQKVLAIGNPFGFNRTLTTGIISRVDNKKNKIQTDAAINPGSSGGPLLNYRGEVIGINQSIYNPDNNKSNIGIGFAVPINVAREFIEATKKKNPNLFK